VRFEGNNSHSCESSDTRDQGSARSQTFVIGSEDFSRLTSL
jgi:hypothetical protein